MVGTKAIATGHEGRCVEGEDDVGVRYGIKPVVESLGDTLKRSLTSCVSQAVNYRQMRA